MARKNDSYNEDSIILTVGEFIFNIMVLNVLWFFCSLPVVTIGASTTALNYTCIKMRNDEGDSIIKMFFRSYTQNIRQALVIWTGILSLLIILFAGLMQQLGNANAGSGLAVAFSIFLIILITIILTMSVYIFFVLSRFDNSIFRTIANAIILMIRHPADTVKVMAIVMFSLLILPSFLWAFFPYGFPLVLFFDIPLTAYILSGIFNRQFKEYIPELNEE